MAAAPGLVLPLPNTSQEKGGANRTEGPSPMQKSNVPRTSTITQSPCRCSAVTLFDQLSVLLPRVASVPSTTALTACSFVSAEL